MKDYELNDNDIKDIGIVKNMMAQVLEKSYSPYSKFKVGAILHRKMCICKSNIKWSKKE